jgi:HEAT repeat protein
MIMNMHLPGKLNIKIISMIIFVLLCCTGIGFGQNENNQLKINQWSLYNSTDEQIRFDTAKELLENPSPAAREILLNALNTTDNVGATSSVCKAISSFRSSAYLIQNRLDFILPLMNILRGSNAETAKLAAHATLIFSLKEVKNYIDPILRDPQLPEMTRKNAVYALQIRPDRESLFQLIDLLDNTDPVISSSAVQALNEWMPLGDDKARWLRVREDIEKGKIDIIRERLLTGQDKIQNLNEDIFKWQKKYLTSLDNIYLAMADAICVPFLFCINLGSPWCIWVLELSLLK